MDIYQKAENIINKIEEEMRVKGLWQNEALEPEKFCSTKAFCLDTMTFVQWLQFVLLPRVKSIILSKGEFPAASEVSQQATREFLMYPLYSKNKTKKLLELLTEFDDLFEYKMSK